MARLVKLQGPVRQVVARHLCIIQPAVGAAHGLRPSLLRGRATGRVRSSVLPLTQQQAFRVCCPAVVTQVVQVYTYMLNPLGVSGNGQPPVDQPPFGGVAAADPAAAAAAGGPNPGGAGQSPAAKQLYSKITGYELKLVLEYCNAVRCPSAWSGVNLATF